MVYARGLEGGKVIDLGVSGALYRDALVMYDRKTGSSWSQVTGEAIFGPLRGHRLAEVRSVVTTWEEWRREHPDTLVLRSDFGPRRSPYEGYSANPEKLGVLGTKNPDERLPGKTWVWGFAEGGATVGIVEERVGGKARALRVGGREVEVSRRGSRLLVSPAGVIEPKRMYWYVWARFHPGSRIWPERAEP